MALQIAAAVVMSAISYAMQDRKDVGKRSDTNVFSQYGDAKPYLVGTNRLPCTITWAPPLIVRTKNTSVKGGQKVKEHSYYLNAQLMFSHSSTEVLLGIINNKKKIYTNETGSKTKSLLASLNKAKNIKFYNGSQKYADSLIERYEGAGKVSAHKNRSYLIVEEFSVGQDSNYQFEVIASTNPLSTVNVENIHTEISNQNFFIKVIDENNYRVMRHSGYNGSSTLSIIDVKSNGDVDRYSRVTHSREDTGVSYWGSNPTLYKNDEKGELLAFVNSKGDLSLKHTSFIFENEIAPLRFYNLDFEGGADNLKIVNTKGFLTVYREVYRGVNVNSKKYLKNFYDNNKSSEIEFTETIRDIEHSSNYLYILTDTKIIRYSKDLLTSKVIYTNNINLESLNNFKIINDDIIYFTERYSLSAVGYLRFKEYRNGDVKNLHTNTIDLSRDYADVKDEIYTSNGESFIFTDFTRRAIDFVSFTHNGNFLTLEQVILEIAKVQMPNSLHLIDASALAHIKCYGFNFYMNKSFDEQIEVLMQLYNFVKRTENNNKVVYLPKGGKVVARISTEQMNASNSENSSAGEPLKKYNKQDSELAKKFILNFIDRNSAYRQASVFSELKNISSEATITIDSTGAFSPEEARTICLQGILTNNTERMTFECSVGEEFSHLQVADSVELDDNGTIYTARITEITDNNNGIYNLKLVQEDRTIYEQKQVGESAPSRSDDVEYLADSVFVPLDIPLLRDQDEGKGMYYAVGPNSDDSWRGCTLMTSVDTGISYSSFAEITKDKAAVLGTAQSVLSDFKLTLNREANSFDLQNSVIVKTNGVDQLRSASIDELKNSNANYAYLGGEIIQFLNAIPVQGQKNTYRLTGLIRGLKGTEKYKSTHTLYERFVLLDESKLQILPFPTSKFDSENYIKAITFGEYEDNAKPVKFTYVGQAYECYSPVHLGGGFDTDKAILKWKRRGRLNNSWLNKVDVPLSELTEAYEIEILKNGNVVRTLTSTTNTINYSNAMMIEDFSSIQNELYFNVYQISELRARGEKAQGYIKR